MQPPRSLILVTIDCLRADHVGFLGYDRPTTPFLDSLAGQSFVFNNAITAGTPTYYSLPAVLASRYPLALGRDMLGIAPDETTIATAVSESGFQTAAFLAANPYLSARFGYDVGFATFEDFLDAGALDFTIEREASSDVALRHRANQQLSKICHAVEPLGRAYDELYFHYCQKQNAGRDESLDWLRKFPSADVIVDRAISWLNENTGASFFLWLHLMDPHAPYFPKKAALESMGDTEIDAAQARYLNSYWVRGDVDARRLQRKRNQVIALYDAGIRWADTQLRRLMEMLTKLNLWNSCTLAVTADHGEEFLDHGGRFHPPLELHDELIRVPLLLRVPGRSAGEVIHQPFRLIDLAPTLLDVMELPIPGDFRGRSCWRDIVAGKAADRTLVTECVRGCTNPLHAETRCAPRLLAVRRGEHKLIIDFEKGTEELFDLRSDPREQEPLPAGSQGTVRRELMECARRHILVSRKSRDLDKRLSMQIREHRLGWAQPTAGMAN